MSVVFKYKSSDNDNKNILIQTALFERCAEQLALTNMAARETVKNSLKKGKVAKECGRRRRILSSINGFCKIVVIK